MLRPDLQVLRTPESLRDHAWRKIHHRRAPLRTQHPGLYGSDGASKTAVDSPSSQGFRVFGRCSGLVELVGPNHSARRALKQTARVGLQEIGL